MATFCEIFHCENAYLILTVVVWRSGPFVARLVRNRTAPGSNPVADTRVAA